MPDWRAQIRARISRLGLDPTREADLADELGQHLEDRYQDLIARGASAAAAEALVASEHLDDGSLRRALSATEPAAGPPGPVLGSERRGLLAGLRSDLWFAARSLVRNPGLAGIVFLTLAIGIGANVVVFSVVNALLLRPLPFPDSDRLVSFWGTAPEKRLPVVNYPDALYDYYRRRARTVDLLAFYNFYGVTLNRAGEAERVDATEVTTDFFKLLGVNPLHGRTFSVEENVAGTSLAVVLSHGLWQRRFGGDPAIVGQSIRVDETAATVVGVMPRGFDFPYRSQLWLPIGIEASSINCWCYDAIGRLASGRTPADLVTEIEGLNADFWAEREGRARPTPNAGAPPGTIAVPLARQQVGDLRTPVLVLLGAVGTVLLIACANLASLLLVRAVGRSREIAIRTALGASPWRIVRQVSAETGLLAVGGAAAGLLVGWLGVRVIERSVIDRVTFLASIPLDPGVLGFAVAATLVTVLVFGIAPAVQGARVALAPSLREGARGTEGRTHRRLNGGFVVAQLALAVVLLTGSGLLIRSLLKLMAVEPGFQAKQVVIGRISVPYNAYNEMPQVRRLALAFLERVRSVPGIVAAGLTSTAPFGRGNNQQELRVEGQDPGEGEPTPVTSVRRVSVGYFEAIGTPLLQGRYFEEADRDSAQQVVIIDEGMARRYWPGGNPIGARINTDGRDRPNWRTVVGVVASIHHRDLSKAPDYYVYQPLTQGYAWSLDVVVRSAVPFAATEQALRRALSATDPRIPLYDVQSLEAAVDGTLSARRLTNRLLVAFAVAALALAAIGIYGVMTRMVLARTREFGVRLALGASPTAVRGLVVRQSAILVALGLGLGLVGAAGLSRLLGSLLFEVDPIDPMTFAITPVLLVAVAATATFLPAHRATAVDPLVAIRSE